MINDKILEIFNRLIDIFKQITRNSFYNKERKNE